MTDFSHYSVATAEIEALYEYLLALRHPFKVFVKSRQLCEVKMKASTNDAIAPRLLTTHFELADGSTRSFFTVARKLKVLYSARRGSVRAKAIAVA